MNGDAADLSALIRWAETFWGATSGQNWDGGDFRQDLNDAMLRLCDAFDTAYKAHQAAFHLGGAKKTKVVSALLPDRRRSAHVPIRRKLLSIGILSTSAQSC